MKKVLVLLALSAFFLFSCGGEEKSTATNESSGNVTAEKENTEKESEAMPNPSFYTIDGEVVDLASFQGKPLVLNLWASWCPPCKEELPNFNEAYKNFNSEVNFACVSLVDGDRETTESAMNFINENNYELPFYFDTDQEVAYGFRVTSIPVTYFINSDGTEYVKHIGLMTEEQLEKRIEELIANNN